MRTCLLLVILCNIVLKHSHAQQTDSIPLYAGAIPYSKSGHSIVETIEHRPGGIDILSGVTVPYLKLFLPPPEKRNGTMVIICPGGGYYVLANKHEGTDIALWFNSLGVSAAVLHYRLPDARAMEQPSIVPITDLQQAIRLIRQRASEWQINPERVGVMGFSAGGHLASTAAVRFGSPIDGLRPDFVILIYPVISMRSQFGRSGSREALLGKNPDSQTIDNFSNELLVSAQTPPTFLIHTTDDPLDVQHSIAFYTALKAHGVAAEMHLFAKGGHGYGMAADSNLPIAAWPQLCESWMHSMGFLPPKK
jgi:acetyl esterase/lipase